MGYPLDSLDIGVLAPSHRPARTQWFWSELALRREQRRPANHALMTAVERGEASQEALTAIADEHDHVLAAGASLARVMFATSEGLLRSALLRLAGERARQLSAWRRFALAVGWRPTGERAHEPSLATLDWLRTIWDPRHQDLASRLVTAHVLAGADADVTTSIAAGMRKHHALDELRLRRLAAMTDVATGHADLTQDALAGLLGGSDYFALLNRAEVVLRRSWQMLDEIAADGRT